MQINVLQKRERLTSIGNKLWLPKGKGREEEQIKGMRVKNYYYKIVKQQGYTPQDN